MWVETDNNLLVDLDGVRYIGISPDGLTLWAVYLFGDGQPTSVTLFQAEVPEMAAAAYNLIVRALERQDVICRLSAAAAMQWLQERRA